MRFIEINLEIEFYCQCAWVIQSYCLIVLTVKIFVHAMLQMSASPEPTATRKPEITIHYC